MKYEINAKNRKGSQAQVFMRVVAAKVKAKVQPRFPKKSKGTTKNGYYEGIFGFSKSIFIVFVTKNA